MKGAPLRTCAASLRINAGGGLMGRQLILGGGKEMSAQQGTGTNTYVEVVPLTLHIGAEIRGVDLSKPLPPEQVKEVRDAFLKWKVVFFRGQNLDHTQHVAMARSSASRPSGMRCSAISRAIPRSTRSPRTAPPTRTEKR